MAFVGSHFGMGLGNLLFIFFFFIFGLIIGIHFKIISSSIIFLFIFFGSLFSKGNGTTVAVILFFIIGIIIARNTKNHFSNTNLDKYF